MKKIILNNELKKEIIRKIVIYYNHYNKSGEIGYNFNEYISVANDKIQGLYNYIVEQCLLYNDNYQPLLGNNDLQNIYFLTPDEDLGIYSSKNYYVKIYKGVKYIDFLDLYSILTYGDIIDMKNNELIEYYNSLLTKLHPTGFGIVVNDYHLEKITRRKNQLFGFNVEKYIKN